jgi:hypothetical protein
MGFGEVVAVEPRCHATVSNGMPRWLGLSTLEISLWGLFRVAAWAVGFDLGEFAAIRRGSYSLGVA